MWKPNKKVKGYKLTVKCRFLVFSIFKGNFFFQDILVIGSISKYLSGLDAKVDAFQERKI